jgi:hypothetical protein
MKMPDRKSQTTILAEFLDRPEVRSALDAITAACKRESELKAIRDEFNYSPYAMATEIWKLRKTATHQCGWTD